MRGDKSKLLVIFGTVAVMTIGTAVTTFFMGLRVGTCVQAMSRSQEILDGLEATLTTVRDAETGQRGFLLTGDEAYLEPYTAAMAALPGRVKQLQAWGKSGDVDQAEATAAIQLINTRTVELTKAIGLRRTEGQAAALAAVAAGEGQREMVQLREHIAKMQRDENAELEGNRQERDRATALRTNVFALAAAVDLAFLVWCYRRVSRALMQAREAAAAEQSQKELLGVTLASIGDGVIVTDVGGCVTFMNGVAQQLTGWPIGEAQGRSLEEVFAIVNEDTREPVENPALRALRVGTVVGLANHTILKAKDGRELPIDDSAAPIRKPDGSLYGAVLVFRDFSRQKAAERALREASQRLEMHVENSPVAVVEFDRELKVRLWTEAAERVFGWSAEEVVGKWLWDIPWIPEEDREKIRGVSARLMGGADARSISPNRNLRKDGSTIHCEWYNSALKDEAGEVMSILSLVLDVTDRVQAQDAVRNSESRHRGFFQLATVGLAMAEWGTGKLIQVNERMCAITGYSANELMGMHIADFTHPEDQPATATEYQGIVQGRSESYTIEKRYVRKDGEVIWALVNATAIRDAAGRPFATAAVVQEITDRKRVEQDLKEAKEAAEAANRAKDQFLAVLSHELRTPLTPVLTVTQLMEQDPSLPQAQREAFNMIRRNVDLEARLIDDLLDLTRISQGKTQLHFASVDVHEQIDQVVRMCEGDIAAKHLRLVVEAGAAERHVRADSARFQQVMWNLLKNAVKFTPPGGEIQIRTSNLRDDWITVEVKDSGIGIAPEVLPRLFNAFEQGSSEVTRQFGGLGLGLAISKGVMDLHGGTLRARSDGPGRGSIFAAELRTAPVETVSAPVALPGAGRLAKPGERVLLVEDHPDTAWVMSRLLRRFGYETKTSDSVASALRAIEAESFALVISDIGLPDGSGLDLMRQIRARQHVTAIALSGFGMEEDISRSLEAGFSAHLTKPVDIRRLEQVVRTLMESRTADADRP